MVSDTVVTRSCVVVAGLACVACGGDEAGGGNDAAPTDGLQADSRNPDAPFVDMARQVFVTSTSGTEVFASWADAGGATGLAAADAICQQRAMAGGLEGTFRAWVSDENDDAICRIVGLSGLKGDNACGAGTLPAAGPWLRRDGEAVAASAAELISVERGFVRVPIDRDEVGQVRETVVWTNTRETGNYAGGLLFGMSTGTTPGWTHYDPTADEGDTAALYCFELGTGPALPPPGSGKLMFLSSAIGGGQLGSWPLAGGATGITAGDNVCKALAAQAGFPDASSFIAWLSDGTTNAANRITSDGPWFRPDGVMVAGSKAELVSGHLRTSPNQRETMVYIPWNLLIGNIVWTGTSPDGASVGGCSNWTGGSSGGAGRPAVVDGRWTSGSTPSCNVPGGLYCVQN